MFMECYCNSFKWTDILVVFTAIGTLIVLMYQYRNNKRQLLLQDYVAISFVPGGEVITVLNTGAVNVYIHAFFINETKTAFSKARMIPAKAMDQSSYWIPLDNSVPIGEFKIRLYLEDEFNRKYIAEGGGESSRINANEISARVWTYKISPCNWSL